MTAVSPAAHPLDHLVLPVASLTVARERLSRLGFTVADDARHPFGTQNACVFFADGTYLEPLSIYDHTLAEAAALAGNVFVARDLAFRFRRGEEGLSALVLSTSDAAADHARFRSSALSAGEMLEFSRHMTLPDGSAAIGSFLLAFAADLRSPDFFLFACERIQPLPVDRGALERHDNGVTGISEVVLCEPEPRDFLDALCITTGASALSSPLPPSLSLAMPNAVLSVLDPQSMRARFARRSTGHSRGLRGHAVVFRVTDLGAAARLLSANGIEAVQTNDLLLVDEAPGQGVIFAFGETE